MSCRWILTDADDDDDDVAVVMMMHPYTYHTADQQHGVLMSVLVAIVKKVSK